MAEQPSNRSLVIAATLVVGVALAGFAVGIQRGPSRARTTGAVPERGDFPADVVARAHGVVPAIPYGQLPMVRRGPNAAWRSDLAAVAADKQPIPEAQRRASAEEVAAALDARAQRRAFDGAPPTVPHPIEQQSADACLACHEKGLLAGSRRAPAISHRAFVSCTQCHVEAREPSVAPPDPADVASAFVGLASPTAGARAFEGAPPTMPHPSWMRERCGSCHGPSAHPGLQTSHLARRSCEQCHAPAAIFDQRLDAAGGPPGPWSP